jgi:hypothetical protein
MDQVLYSSDSVLFCVSEYQAMNRMQKKKKKSLILVFTGSQNELATGNEAIVMFDPSLRLKSE